MKTGKDKHTEPSEDSLESTLRNIDARPKPPAELEQAVYQHVLEDWKKLGTNKKRKKIAIYWSVAASLLMAILIQPLLFQPEDGVRDVQALGLVENQRGSVFLIQDDERIQITAADKAKLLFPEQSISTGTNAGLAILWGDVNSVRVDENTEIHLSSSTDIELISGRIYVDIPPVSGQNQSGFELRVVTRLGTVNHIGTQFMVTSDADSVEVRVREGSVSIDNSNQVLVMQKGQLTKLSDSAKLNQQVVSTYGPDWQWTEKLTPAFALEGKALSDFLDWVGRESGREVLFDSIAAKDIARNTIMHGSIDEEPLRALDIILDTNDLSWYEQDGKVILFLEL